MAVTAATTAAAPVTTMSTTAATTTIGGAPLTTAAATTATATATTATAATTTTNAAATTTNAAATTIIGGATPTTAAATPPATVPDGITVPCETIEAQIVASVTAFGDLYCNQATTVLDEAFMTFEKMNPACDLTNPCSNAIESPEESSAFANSFSAILMLLFCFFFKK